MHKRTKALIDYGKLCGFEVDGVDGNEHYVLRHPNGAVHRVASTPGDYRGDRNAEAAMRRLSGANPPRPKSGKYRRGVNVEAFKPTVERVDSLSHKRALLLKRHRELCDRIAWCQSEGDRDGAEEAIPELLDVEGEFEALGESPPLRRFRAFY